MLAARIGSRPLHCRDETILTAAEKHRFETFLEKHDLSEDIFAFFESLVELSTDNERFLFVKVYLGDELVGLAMFARIARSNLHHSLNSRLRRYSFLEPLGRALASTLYFSMHSLSSPGLPRSFLYTEKQHEDAVNEAILSWLQSQTDANAVTIIDSAEKSDLYARNGFACLPFTSDSWLDVTHYETIDDYLSIRRRTRKSLSQFRKRQNVTVETLRGDVPEEVKQGMRACLQSSIQHSKVVLPVQDFFNRNIFRTALFGSDQFIHFIVRVEGHVVGFSSRLCCGRNLIGIMGGYDRDRALGAPIYDLMIVATLDYCIRNNYRRLCYGLVDNHTKGRMMDSFREQRFYFYSSSALRMRVMQHAYRYLSGYELYRIDQDSRKERKEWHGH